MAKDKKFVAELFRDLLLFFAVIFFTCVVGIIGLLPEFEETNGLLSWSTIVISVLYFGLLVGIDYSLDRCFFLYKQNKAYGGEFGFKYPELEGLLKIFKETKYLEGLLITGITVVFFLLFLVKIGILH